MKIILTLLCSYLLFSVTACKKDKYIPPQDANGKICIEQIDNIKRNCDRNAQQEYRYCKKKKGKNCRLKDQVCITQYKADYIKCGGKIEREKEYKSLFKSIVTSQLIIKMSS